LEILDALITLAGRSAHPGLEFASSREEAERLYEQVAAQLRADVARMVK
jgi:hypothetical protein